MRKDSFSVFTIASIFIAALLLSACGGSGAGSSGSHGAYVPQGARTASSTISTPALLSIDTNTRALEYWPISGGGSQMPKIVANNVADAGAMAADGNVVAIANGSQVVRYDVQTRSRTTLPDTFGEGFDIAIGKDHSIYVLNRIPKSSAGNVIVYAPGSSTPKKLDCPLIGFPGYIAVDVEGNVFYNGLFRKNQNNQGLIAIPHGNAPGCRALNLNAETGYISGVAVDPKTDALVTLSAPDFCAGGIEAEMTIYPKPYQKSTATVREMSGNCSGGLRLNADSTAVFYGDADVSGSYSFIHEATYPAGKDFAAYGHGQPSGMTTIPNTLPN